MIKNYLLIFINLVFSLSLFLLPADLFPQEPRIFMRSDFELIGPVKSCRVITDYGKEDFEFNSDGLLTKSVTRYNEKDYDVSYYKYESNRLVERRDERYQDGTFDEVTSMAHFYSYDSLDQNRIIERILSYNKEFQEQYEYYYNTDKQLIRILRSHAEGVDETQIEYTKNDQESNVTYMMNGLLQKSVRTSKKSSEDGNELKVVLSKSFIDGIPERANERILNDKGLLVSELDFAYSEKKKSFVPLTKTDYLYDAQDQLESVTSTIGDSKRIKEYLYQFDSSDGGNWVKKIITPENSYTTRVIEYFELGQKPQNR